MHSLFVRLMAVTFALFGVAFVFFPAPLLLETVGEVPVSSSALIDLRATYGGISIAVAIMLFMLAASPQTLKMGVLASTVLMVSMASGRTVGILVDGNANGYMLLYLGLEVLAALIGALLLARTPSADAAP